MHQKFCLFYIFVLLILHLQSGQASKSAALSSLKKLLHNRERAKFHRENEVSTVLLLNCFKLPIITTQYLFTRS